MSLPLPGDANRVAPVAMFLRGLLKYRATPPSGNSFKWAPSSGGQSSTRDGQRHRQSGNVPDESCKLPGYRHDCDIGVFPAYC